MRHFHDQLENLLQTLVRMGCLAESMIQQAVEGLFDPGEALAAEILGKERQVNALQVEVDDRVVKLTILQQPMARDARFLFMSSRIGGELERIADQAINIHQNTGHLRRELPPGSVAELPKMAQVTQGMVRDSLTAMIDRDLALADRVLEEEKKVDAYRDRIFKALLAGMVNDPATIQPALSLILIARNLERIGDHATNIAEEVIYWIQGRDVRHGQVRPAEIG